MHTSHTCFGPKTQVMLSFTWSLPFVDTVVVFFPFSTWLLHIILTPVLTRQYPCRTCASFENSLLMFLRNSLWRTGKVEKMFSNNTVVPTSLAQGFLESSFPLWSYSSLVATVWDEWCVTIVSLLQREEYFRWFEGPVLSKNMVSFTHYPALRSP